MFQRTLSLHGQRSFFLLGARGVGKTTLLEQSFKNKNTLWINLLTEKDETLFRRNPEALSEILNQKKYAHVVIDEIQKNPKLLEIVHLEIGKRKTQFILTGSSARKLKRGQADMLAGRASTFYLYPLTHVELKNAFHLEDVMRFGSLPELYHIETETEKMDYLRSYVQTYLKEEVILEQLIRKIDPFRDFLPVAAQSNGEILQYSSMAKDIGVDPKTVETYFQILSDTLLGFLLPAYHTSVRKQHRLSPKFYLFDSGVKRAMENKIRLPVEPRTYDYGKAFEHVLIAEAFRLSHYHKRDYRFSYLRTKDNAEIDLIIERPGEKDLLVEIKSSTHVHEKHINALLKFQTTWPKPCEAVVWSMEKYNRKSGKVTVLNWKDGLAMASLT